MLLFITILFNVSRNILLYLRGHISTTQKVKQIINHKSQQDIDCQQQIDAHIPEQEVQQNKTDLQKYNYHGTLQMGQADPQQFVVNMSAIRLEG